MVALTLAALASIGMLALVLARREPWTLDIASLPPAAEVTVDGRYLGQAPLRATLAKGQSHLVRVERAGFEPSTREVKPGEWSLHFVLKRSPFLISVITDPPGAEVLLNDQPVGTTPLWSFTVPGEGVQQLRLHKPGYRDWSTKLERGAPLPTLIRLQPSR